jgi:hypothetical protein
MACAKALSRLPGASSANLQCGGRHIHSKAHVAGQTASCPALVRQIFSNYNEPEQTSKLHKGRKCVAGETTLGDCYLCSGIEAS